MVSKHVSQQNCVISVKMYPEVINYFLRSEKKRIAVDRDLLVNGKSKAFNLKKHVLTNFLSTISGTLSDFS